MDRSSVVSPDGKWAAFLKDHNLWIRAVDGSGEFALTTDGVEDDGYAGSTGNNLHPVSPQRRGVQPPPVDHVVARFAARFSLTAWIERQVKELYLLQSVPDDGSIRAKAYRYRYAMPNDEHKAQVRQMVFDVTTRQRVDLDFPVLATPYVTPVEVHDAWWSDDSREVIYVERGPFYRTLTLRVADASSGKSRTLIEESGKTFIELAGVGHRPIVRLLSNGTVLWFSERDGWGHLYLYDKKGRARQITRGEWLVRGIVGVDERQWHGVLHRIRARAGPQSLFPSSLSRAARRLGSEAADAGECRTSDQHSGRFAAQLRRPRIRSPARRKHSACRRRASTSSMFTPVPTRPRPACCAQSTGG